MFFGVLIGMFLIGGVSGLTNYAASSEGGVASVSFLAGFANGVPEPGSVIENVNDENDATKYGVTITTEGRAWSQFTATIMFSQTAPEITQIEWIKQMQSGGGDEEYNYCYIEILQSGGWTNIGNCFPPGPNSPGSLTGSWQNVDGVRVYIEARSEGMRMFYVTSYARLFELEAWGSDAGPVCGDDTCDAPAETCGDTDIAPECNSDCGVCVGSCGEVDDSRLIMRLFQDDNSHGALWNFSSEGGGGGGLSFGNQVVGTSTSNIGNYISGGVYTAPQDGVIDNMTMSMLSGWGVGENLKCAIYDQNRDFLASTEERSDGGIGWQTFVFASPVAVSAGQDYSLVCWGDSSMTMQSEPGSSGNYFQSTSYGSWPAALGVGGSSYEKSIYATYGDEGGVGYDVEVCYPASFAPYVGAPSTVRDCSGTGAIPDNKVVGLYDIVNSHAEVPGADVYDVDVCYGDLTCRSDVDAAGCVSWGGEVILSLYDSTNSHLALGDFAGYDTKICCSDGGVVVPSVLEWRDMSGNVITDAQVGDTVQMVMVDSGSGTFEIFEEDDGIIGFLFGGDDEIRSVEGVAVGSDLVGVWTITEEDLALTSDYGEFKFGVGGEVSGDLAIDNNNEDDEPMVVSIISPVCGEDFDESEIVAIDVAAVDVDDLIYGNVTIDGSVTSFDNGGVAFDYPFNLPGNYQVVVEAVNSRGEKSRSISSVMVLDMEGGDYVDGTYVAACIDKPEDFSNIPGSVVEFDASNTRGIKVIGEVPIEVLPGSTSMDFYWSFFPDGRTYGDAYVGTGNSLVYDFITEFAVAGDNSAVLRVEVN